MKDCNRADMDTVCKELAAQLEARIKMYREGCVCPSEFIDAVLTEASMADTLRDTAVCTTWHADDCHCRADKQAH